MYTTSTSDSTTTSSNPSTSVDYAGIVLRIILILVSFYLAVVVCIFLVRKNNNKKVRFSNLTMANKFSFLSVIVVLIISSLSFIRNVTYGTAIYWMVNAYSHNMTSFGESQAAANIGCAVTTGIGDFSLTLGVGFVYVFLWLRQRIFYVHPTLKSLTNKYISFASQTIIVLWVVYYSVIMIAFIAIIRFEFDRKTGSCLVKDEVSRMWFRGIIISWAVSSIVMQLFLLALFSYPLLKQASWRKNNNVDHSYLLDRVKKSAVLTIISLLSDTISFVLPAVIDQGLTVVYNLNLIINTLVVIIYFDYWQNILLPCKKQLSYQSAGTVSGPFNSVVSKVGASAPLGALTTKWAIGGR